MWSKKRKIYIKIALYQQYCKSKFLKAFTKSCINLVSIVFLLRVSLKQLSFGFRIPRNCLTSSINNFTSRILSDFEVDDWIVEMFWEELSDFLLAYSNNIFWFEFVFFLVKALRMIKTIFFCFIEPISRWHFWHRWSWLRRYELIDILLLLLLVVMLL